MFFSLYKWHTAALNISVAKLRLTFMFSPVWNESLFWLKSVPPTLLSLTLPCQWQENILVILVQQWLAPSSDPHLTLTPTSLWALVKCRQSWFNSRKVFLWLLSANTCGAQTNSGIWSTFSFHDREPTQTSLGNVWCSKCSLQNWATDQPHSIQYTGLCQRRGSRKRAAFRSALHASLWSCWRHSIWTAHRDIKEESESSLQLYITSVWQAGSAYLSLNFFKH